MSLGRALLVLLAWSLAPGAALARDFYVDDAATGAADGTSWSNAWPTLDQIAWASISPGDTVHLSGGTYTDTDGTAIMQSGTESAPIRIVASREPGHDGLVILDTGIGIGGDWITIDGSRDDAFAARQIGDDTLAVPSIRDNIGIRITHGVGCFGDRCSGLHARWLDITNPETPGMPDSARNRHGVSFRAESVDFRAAELAYVWIHHVGSDGVAMLSNSVAPAQDDLVIHHCLIELVGDDGVETNGGTTIHHSILRDTRFIIGHPDGVQSTGSFIHLYDNVFNDWANSHIRTQGWDERYESIHIYGNLFYDDGHDAQGNALSWASLPLTATSIELAWYGDRQPWNTRDVSFWQSFVIANNTFVSLAPRVVLGLAKRDHLGQARLREWHVDNNAILDGGDDDGIALGVGGSEDGAGGFQATTDDVSFEANVVARADSSASLSIGYLVGGDRETPWGRVYSTAEALNAATRFDRNASAVPVFESLDSWDLAPAASDTVLVDRGTDLSSLALPGLDVDLRGTRRGHGAGWDIGAIELGAGEPPGDAGVPHADAGAIPRGDAGVRLPVDAGVANSPMTSSGCGCRCASTTSDARAALGVALVVLGAVARRRRRSADVRG